MLPLVDRDGLTKPVLQIIAEEAMDSGIEEICVVAAPGDEAVYRRHFRSYAENLRSAFKGVDWAEEQARRLVELEQRLRFAVQPEPEGYGHAVWCAREFVAGRAVPAAAGRPPLHLQATRRRRCARQLLDLAAAEGCAVSAVQATREHLIHQYGTLTGKRDPDRPDVYVIDEIIEKPNPTLAELRLQVPGLRAGHYLCFFGMHVLTPAVFDLLDELVRRDVREAGPDPAHDRPERAWPAARSTWPWRPRARGTTSASSTASSTPRSPWPWPGVDRERMLAGLLESIVRIEQTERVTRRPRPAGTPIHALDRRVPMMTPPRTAPADRDDHQRPTRRSATARSAT